MKSKPILVAVFLVALVLVASVAQAEAFYAVLLNDDTPWVVMDAQRQVYVLDWYGGSILFWKGDTVLLTQRWGFAKMVGLTGLSKGKTAKVWITRK